MSASRLEKLRSAMKEGQVDALLISKPENRAYLSGFTGSAGWLLITQQHAYLITDFRYVEQATAEAPLFTVLKPDGMPQALLAELCQQAQVSRVGIEGDFVTVDDFATYSQALAQQELVSVTGLVESLRMVKDADELALMRRAAEITDQAFQHVLGFIKPGVTENELIGGAEGFLRSRGAEDMLILTRSQKPHSFITRATDVPVKEDGVFVYSAEVAGPGGYWTQLIRPIFMSYDAQPEAQAILEVIKEAEKAGAAMIRPGNKIRDIAIAIEEVVAKRGYKTGVWSGHGMGADLGDGIDIGASNDMEIVPNMIFTLHPSVVSDTDGLLFGNTFVSTEGEAICLTPQYQDSLFIDDLRKVIK